MGAQVTHASRSMAPGQSATPAATGTQADIRGAGPQRGAACVLCCAGRGGWRRCVLLGGSGSSAVPAAGLVLSAVGWVEGFQTYLLVLVE